MGLRRKERRGAKGEVALLGHVAGISPRSISGTLQGMLRHFIEELAAILGHELPEGEQAGATARLAEDIIATADAEGGPGLEWVLGLLEQDLTDDELGRRSNRFTFDLREALENEV